MVTKATQLIAERITKARISADLTEVSLADRSGIARTTMRRKLSGFGDINISDMQRIGNVVGVNWMDWLRNLPEDAD